MTKPALTVGSAHGVPTLEGTTEHPDPEHVLSEALRLAQAQGYHVIGGGLGTSEDSNLVMVLLSVVGVN